MSKMIGYIREPQTATEAEDIIHKIAKAFKMEAIVISQADFDDKMGTEDWNEDKMSKAVSTATEEVADHVGFAIDNAIWELNRK